MNREDDLLQYISEHEDSRIVIYGAGKVGRKCLSYVKRVDYFCDKNAGSIVEVDGIPCITPEELEKLSLPLLVIIAVSDNQLRDEIESHLKSINESFVIKDFIKRNNNKPVIKECKIKKKLKINIVYKRDGWILGKFAERLQTELNRMGQECVISDEEDPEADVNHFIIYWSLPEIYKCTNTCRTTMITHIETNEKVDFLKYHADNDVIGICMSKDTQLKLQRWGLPANRVCYVNPAHDGVIKPQKTKLGITNRCYSGTIDYRKKDDVILDIMRNLNVDSFKLWIMGSGWDAIVVELREMGLEVDYDSEFEMQKYIEKMQTLDYWMYFGFDEGAMGFLDAVSAGVKTITTPQGYHLDVKDGLTYPCNTIEDFANVLRKIQEESIRRTKSVEDWTWSNYAQKHLEIWQYLTGTARLKDIYKNQGKYLDGIYSLLIQNNDI